jgi:endonuclease/exonuclease/phosphatase (EEP) superfamily protein YafD
MTQAMMRTTTAIAVSALIAGAACSHPTAPVVRPPAAGEPLLRVLTFNINYGMSGDDETLRAIGDPDADVVLLQETSPAWERRIRGALAMRYPAMAFRYRGAASGMAVLSRLPVQSIDFLAPEGDGWFPAARVIVRAPFGPVQILSVHLRPPFSDGGSFVVGYFSTPSVRRQEIERFVRQLTPSLATLVVGDFNEEPDGGVTEYLTGRGMQSALPLFAPETPTWRWTTSVGTFRRQLDHIVHDRRLQPVSVQVLSAGRSDHMPVLAVFRAGS